MRASGNSLKARLTQPLLASRSTVHVQRPVRKCRDGFEVERTGKYGPHWLIEQHVVRARRQGHQLGLLHDREPDAGGHGDQVRRVLGRQQGIAPARGPRVIDDRAVDRVLQLGQPASIPDEMTAPGVLDLNQGCPAR